MELLTKTEALQVQIYEMDDELKQLKVTLVAQENEYSKLNAENEALKVSIEKTQAQNNVERSGQEQEERERIAKFQQELYAYEEHYQQELE